MLREKLKGYNIILASGSPRRQELFKDLDIDFEVRVKPIAETYPDHLQRSQITDYLSKLKATPFNNDLKKNDILITSDTIVWHNSNAIGKPKDEIDAFNMIKSLSNRTHEVITSLCFTMLSKQTVTNACTKVTFRELSDDEIWYYIKSSNPLDKAGAYGIQDWIGKVAVTKIEGSYFNVMGFPSHLVYQTLIEIISSKTK